MSVLKVVYYPDDPLTQKADAVENFDRKLEELIANMIDTMHEYKGVGLAGPQVGHKKRLFVLQEEPESYPIYFINPVIEEMEGSEVGEEGCLSMPEIYGDVSRATYVRLTAQDLKGETFEMEAEGFLARIIQHELDHINGILFPERLDIITRQDKYLEWAEVRERILAESEES